MRLFCSLFVLSSACLLEEQRYVVANEPVAMTVDTPVAFVDEDDNEFFVVERTFRLPITPPRDAQLTALSERAQGMNLPFPRLPWVERDDVELTVDYTIANLGTEPINATLLVDGISEFFAYTPTPEDFHQYEWAVALGPRERMVGSITELEMDELAIDLATVVNGAPNSNLVVQFQSQSGTDPRIRQYVPKVVPALVALRFGLLTNRAENVVLEVSVRAQDHGKRIASRGERRWELPAPVEFVPVVPEEE